MSGRCRMGCERLNAAERFGVQEELDRTEEAPCSFTGAEVEAEHGTKAALLLHGQGVLGMAFEAGIGETGNFGLRGKEVRHGTAVLFVLLHAQGECLDAAQDEEAFE